MLTKMRNHKGFTLIELMIVVAIIGILAAIAIPNFMRFQAKSKQSEARVILSGIFTAQTAYFAEENMYGTTEHNIGFTPASASKYYTTRTMARTVAGNNFSASARGQIDTDASIDVWKINDSDREPHNTTNDVTAG